MTDPKYMRPGLDFAVGKTVEECGEAILEIGELLAAIGKTLRWGWRSVNPETPADQETNAAWIERKIADVRREIADLIGALDNLEREMAERGFS